MKRFISLLTVFMLVFALVVPVGAFSYGDYELPPFPSVDLGKYPYLAVAVIEDTPNKYIAIYSDDYLAVEISSSNSLTGNFNHSSVTALIYTIEEGALSWGESSTITWTTNRGYLGARPIYANYNLYDTDGDLYLAMLTCDGSACPATDVNIDGICDDCGMALMSLSRSPVAPDVTGSNKNYVMFYSGSVYQYTAYTSDSSYTIRGEEYGARYRTYLEPAVTATRFQSYDGINWQQTYNGTTANDYPGEIGWELISSTYDWYTEEGDRFFPVPLWEEVEKVTQGEMSNLTTETAGTMTTLVGCGVGLMACLMALSLFGKRWLLFLR